MSFISLLVLAVLVVAAGEQCEAKFGFGSAKTTSELVDSRNSDVSDIFGQLCDPKQQSSHVAKQLSRVSSILWLNKELARSLQNAPSLSTDENNCLVDYLAPVDELAKMIEAKQPDACSDAHISLVENFHRKYIERRWATSKKDRDEQSPLPDPLKWFFMHYASELSEICQQNFVANLELMAKHSQEAQYGTMFDGMSGKIIQAFQKLLKSPEHITRQEDFVLIWSMIDRLSRKDLHKAGGDGTRMRLKLRDPSTIRAAQQNCRTNLRPFYHETALSSMRLIDLGYYTASSGLVGKRVDISADGRFQNWYAIAQTCDFLLAIEAYEDQSLKGEEVVVVSKEEASLLAPDSTLQRTPVEFNKKPASAWIEGELTTVRVNEDPSKILKLIKSNIKSRVKSFKRVLHKIVKSQLKGNLKGLFVSRKSKDGHKFVKTPEPWAEQALVVTKEAEVKYATAGEPAESATPSTTGAKETEESLLTRSWSDLDEEEKDRLNEELRLHLQKELESASWRRDSLPPPGVLSGYDADHDLDDFSDTDSDTDLDDKDSFDGFRLEDPKPKSRTQRFIEHSNRHPFFYSTGVPCLIVLFILFIIALCG